MVTYKSAKTRTVSVGRLQITAETGVTLDVADETLDQLVAEGFLIKDGGEIAPALAPVVEAPKAEAPAAATKPK